MVRLSLAAIAASLCIASTASASVVAYEVAAGTSGNQSYTGVLGMNFVVNSNVDVLSLGAFDSDGDGLVAGTTLVTELWSRVGNTAGSLLSSVSFTAADAGTLIGGSIFKDITAMTLAAGEYAIVSYGYNGNDRNGNKGGATSGFPWSTNDGGGLLSFVGGGRFGGTAGASIGAVQDGGPDDRYAAGTFTFEPTVVPLPATLPLMLGAFGLFGAVARRKSV